MGWDHMPHSGTFCSGLLPLHLEIGAGFKCTSHQQAAPVTKACVNLNSKQVISQTS